MSYTFVDYHKQGRTVIIRMNRPERRNSQSRDMLTELNQAWHRFMADDDAWIAIFTGTGRAFCSGMDVKEAAAAAEKGIKNIAPLATPLDTGDISKPIIAAVNGFAIGGGFNWAMYCDLRVAAESAVFQVAEVVRSRVSIFLSEGLLDILPHCLTMELALGNRITAPRAYEMGLVNQVVPDEKLMPAALAMADQILELPPLAVSYTLQAVRNLKKSRIVKANSEQWIASALEKLMATDDYREALKSFVEKRRPIYTGR